MKTNWSSKLKSTARQPLGDALDGVVSGLLALDARVARHPLLAGLNGVKPGGTAHLGRLREVLDRDRALVAAGVPASAPAPLSTLALVPDPVATPRAAAPAGAFATPDFVAPAPAPAASAVPVSNTIAASPSARPKHNAQTQAAAEEPIRTRTMARLLAMQGHPARALAIYDALMATDPDPSLRAEAEQLRSRES
ncbi:MAG TPA: hypothetical protein VMF89_33410 [Polyangiales bacterium]|nr:hypothetical protein [Polyangiales bacterium]